MQGSLLRGSLQTILSESSGDLSDFLQSDLLGQDAIRATSVAAGKDVPPLPVLQDLLVQLLSGDEDVGTEARKSSAKNVQDVAVVEHVERAADDAADVAMTEEADDAAQDAEWLPGNLSAKEHPLAGRNQRRSGGRTKKGQHQSARRCESRPSARTRAVCAALVSRGFRCVEKRSSHATGLHNVTQACCGAGTDVRAIVRVRAAAERAKSGRYRRWRPRLQHSRPSCMTRQCSCRRCRTNTILHAKNWRRCTASTDNSPTRCATRFASAAL